MLKIPLSTHKTALYLPSIGLLFATACGDPCLDDGLGAGNCFEQSTLAQDSDSDESDTNVDTSAEQSNSEDETAEGSSTSTDSEDSTEEAEESETETGAETSTETAEETSTETGEGSTETGDDTETETGDPPVPGSCRPSEAYGSAGAYPAFTDPDYAGFLDHPVAIVSSRNNGGFVLHIADISGEPPPPNMSYAAPLYKNPAWTEANLGRVFGLSLDSLGNIYAAGSTVYGANNSANIIRRIDSLSAEVSDFAVLPGMGPGLGNLNYDCISESIYVSNHEDGRIYQLDMDGQILSTFRHSDGDVTMGAPDDPGEPDGQFAPLGERVWAVQSYSGRLYYSVWWEDTGRHNADQDNEIWSVGFTGDEGTFDGAAELEISLPGINNADYSNPVSDIAFANTGVMLLAARTMSGDTSTSAHQSAIRSYIHLADEWVPEEEPYLVGDIVNSAAGGIDQDFEGEYVWVSGDALDFYSPDVVYGIQGFPYGGGSVDNSTLIDLDAEIAGQDKTVYGDLEIPIPADAAPVPPLD